MEKKNMRVKFQKGIVAFAIIFFLVIGGLTYLSTKIDALLYPTVTVATTNTGYIIDDDDDDYTYYDPQGGNTLIPTSSIHTGNLIDDDDDTYYDPQGGNTLIPTSSVHNGEVYYVIKNTDGNYIVAKKQIDILNQNGLYTEITREDTGFLAIIDSDKDLKVGEQVLVKADILW